MPAFFRPDRVRRQTEDRVELQPTTLAPSRDDVSIRSSGSGPSGAGAERVAPSAVLSGACEGPYTAASNACIRLDRLSARHAKC